MCSLCHAYRLSTATISIAVHVAIKVNHLYFCVYVQPHTFHAQENVGRNHRKEALD